MEWKEVNPNQFINEWGCLHGVLLSPSFTLPPFSSLILHTILWICFPNSRWEILSHLCGSPSSGFFWPRNNTRSQEESQCRVEHSHGMDNWRREEDPTENLEPLLDSLHLNTGYTHIQHNTLTSSQNLLYLLVTPWRWDSKGDLEKNVCKEGRKFFQRTPFLLAPWKPHNMSQLTLCTQLRSSVTSHTTFVSMNDGIRIFE